MSRLRSVVVAILLTVAIVRWFEAAQAGETAKADVAAIQADRKLLVGEIERLLRVRADLARQITRLEGDVRYLEGQLQKAQDRPGNDR